MAAVVDNRPVYRPFFSATPLIFITDTLTDKIPIHSKLVSLILGLNIVSFTLIL